MNLEETEAGYDCAGEGQQQFNRPTEIVILEEGLKAPRAVRQ
jgi:hypothetical protein